VAHLLVQPNYGDNKININMLDMLVLNEVGEKVDGADVVTVD
jgi:hypothetical protein